MKAYEGYVRKYKPKSSDLVCKFRVEPNNKKSAERIASESSIGTWTFVKNTRMKKYGAKVFQIKGNYMKIAYPVELFEPGNMPQIYSSIAGNIFNMKGIRNLRLEDVQWPKKIINSFKGPRFGISGVRNTLKIKNRPLCGTIVKPKLGLTWKEHAKVAYEAWSGGIDVVKDDENLTSQSFNNFYKRIKETLRLRKKAEKETGEKKAYMPNISAETNEMLKRGKYVKKLGGRYMMIDILTVGWAGLQTMRNANLGLIIHAHRAMHGALTRNQKHGISMKVLGETAKLIGVDQLHIGTAVGKMLETKEEVIEVKKAIKPVFAVCSGGLYPGLVPPLIKMLGKDIIIQAGGGVSGHPNGTRAGATAMRQAIDATLKGVSLSKYAEKHKELKLALNMWGK